MINPYTIGDKVSWGRNAGYPHQFINGVHITHRCDIAGLSAKYLLAGRGYDSNHIVESAKNLGV